jgi:DMSO/TMAO reductase YedYZ molybdopterin-dependent catalytic subunit
MTEESADPTGFQRILPPGQRLAEGWPVVHYGPIPAGDLNSWEITLTGETHSGEDFSISGSELAQLPQVDVVADLHCVTRWTVPQQCWSGVPLRHLLELCPPAAQADYALVWAEFGYSANLRFEDLASARALLATHYQGEPILAERGGPVRLIIPHLYAYKAPKWFRGIEYLRTPGRGFWEQRGYHAIGDPWREERWSYQE